MTRPVPDQLSIQETIATLNRSALPTVFIEGESDVIVFRGLETSFAQFGLSVFPMHGRSNVLELFRRRNELNNVGQFAFIADQDTWVVTGIPEEFRSNELIFTTGYSIENDIYIDGQLELMLTVSEKAKFDSELALFVEWYALALSRHLIDGSEPIDTSAHQVIDDQVYR